jgi:hypothetical protein
VLTRSPLLGGTVGMTDEGLGAMGDVYDRARAEGFDHVEAAQKARQTFVEFSALLPLHITESLFMLKGLKGARAFGAATLGQIPTEVATEVPQSHFEQAKSKHGKPVGAFLRHDAPEVALEASIGALGQSAAISGVGQMFSSLTSASKGTEQQFYQDLVDKHGENAAYAVVEQQYLNGVLDEQGLLSAKEKIAYTAKLSGQLEGLGLDPNKRQAYVGLQGEIEHLQKAMEGVEDPLLLKTLQTQVADRQKQAVALMDGTMGVVVVTMPTGRQFAYTPQQAERLLQQPALLDGIASGDIKIAYDGEVEGVQEKIDKAVKTVTPKASILQPGNQSPTTNESQAKQTQQTVKVFRAGKKKGDVTFYSKTEDYANEYNDFFLNGEAEVQGEDITFENPMVVELSDEQFTDINVQKPYIAEAKKAGHDVVIFKNNDPEGGYAGEEFYAVIKSNQGKNKENARQNPSQPLPSKEAAPASTAVSQNSKAASETTGEEKEAVGETLLEVRGKKVIADLSDKLGSQEEIDNGEVRDMTWSEFLSEDPEHKVYDKNGVQVYHRGDGAFIAVVDGKVVLNRYGQTGKAKAAKLVNELNGENFDVTNDGFEDLPKEQRFADDKKARFREASLDILGEDLFGDTVEETIEEVVSETQAEEAVDEIKADTTPELTGRAKLLQDVKDARETYWQYHGELVNKYGTFKIGDVISAEELRQLQERADTIVDADRKAKAAYPKERWAKTKKQFDKDVDENTFAVKEGAGKTGAATKGPKRLLLTDKNEEGMIIPDDNNVQRLNGKIREALGEGTTREEIIKVFKGLMKAAKESFDKGTDIVTLVLPNGTELTFTKNIDPKRTDHPDFNHRVVVKKAIQDGSYQQALTDGSMTFDEVEEIVESAGLSVPQDIKDMAGKVSPTKNTANDQTPKYRKHSSSYRRSPRRSKWK